MSNQRPNPISKGAAWLVANADRGLPLALTTLGVFALAFVVRVQELALVIGHDAANRWFGRTQRFWEALADGRWADTYQAPHPGVTLMWSAGESMLLFGNPALGLHTANLAAAKYPSVLAGSLCAGLTLPLAVRALGREGYAVGLLAGLLIATEPMLIGEARQMHVGMMAGGFCWLGVLGTFASIRANSIPGAALTGVAFGLAALSRIAMGPVVAATLLTAVWMQWSKKSMPRPLLIGVCIGVFTLLTMFALWPALWVAPVETIQRALFTSQKWASRPHPHLVGSVRVRTDPGAIFYVQHLFKNGTPEAVLLALIGPFALALRRPRRTWPLLLLACYLPYAISIGMTPKKLPRYLMPLTPLLCGMAAIGVVGVAELAIAPLRRRASATAVGVAFSVLVAGMVVARTGQATSLPAEVRYCSPWPWIDCTPTGPSPLDLRIAAEYVRDEARRYPVLVYPKSRRFAMMSPWVPQKGVKNPYYAHFVFLFPKDFADREMTKLSPGLPEGVRYAVENGPPPYTVGEGTEPTIRIYYGARHRAFKKWHRRNLQRAAVAQEVLDRLPGEAEGDDGAALGGADEAVADGAAKGDVAEDNLAGPGSSARRTDGQEIPGAAEEPGAGRTPPARADRRAAPTPAVGAEDSPTTMR